MRFSRHFSISRGQILCLVKDRKGSAREDPRGGVGGICSVLCCSRIARLIFVHDVDGGGRQSFRLVSHKPTQAKQAIQARSDETGDYSQICSSVTEGRCPDVYRREVGISPLIYTSINEEFLFVYLWRAIIAMHLCTVRLGALKIQAGKADEACGALVTRVVFI